MTSILGTHHRAALVLLAALSVASCTSGKDVPPAATPMSTAPATTSTDDAKGVTPPAKPSTYVVAQGNEVMLARKLQPPFTITPRISGTVTLRTDLWTNATERGALTVEPNGKVRLRSVQILARNPIALHVTHPYTAVAARHYGNAAFPGVDDEKAEQRDVRLEPGQKLALVLVRPDGGCIYQLDQGLATLPCLPETIVGPAGTPDVSWGASTPSGKSGSFWWESPAWLESPEALFNR